MEMAIGMISRREFIGDSLCACDTACLHQSWQNQRCRGKAASLSGRAKEKGFLSVAERSIQLVYNHITDVDRRCNTLAAQTNVTNSY